MDHGTGEGVAAKGGHVQKEKARAARARRRELDELGRRRQRRRCHLLEGGHAGSPTGEKKAGSAGRIKDGSAGSSNRRDARQLKDGRTGGSSSGLAGSSLSRDLLPNSRLSMGGQREL